MDWIPREFIRVKVYGKKVCEACSISSEAIGHQSLVIGNALDFGIPSY
jgi:hypothetical protein